MEKYRSEVTDIGPEALSLMEVDLLIIFNNNAPPELAEITVMHTIEDLKEDVVVGDVITLGGHDYDVVYVGEEANYTLRELGHCTFYLWNEQLERKRLPGYIVINCEEKPVFEIGQPIAINTKDQSETMTYQKGSSYMFGIYQELVELEKTNKRIKVGIIGAGQMGRGLVSQTILVPGEVPTVVADINIDAARNAYINAGIKEEDIAVAETGKEAEEFVAAGKYVITKDAFVVVDSGSAVDVVVDATGVTELGAKISVDCINKGKHIIVLNVEADVVIGPLLHKMAREKGVVYSGTAGDEPGAVMELYDFAKAIGFEVLVIGKGKNNVVNLECTPETCKEEADRKHMNPRMLCCFKDGTKTMVEMTAMCNATGFSPAMDNGSGYHATPKELASVYRMKEDGGILDHYQCVDYINGVAPGVYCIVTSPLPEVKAELKYLSMGDGPNFALYRPYHLTSLETPMSVARIALHNLPSIVPAHGAPYAETTTYAKRDLKAGEYLDGIGGYTIYGGFHDFKYAQSVNALPMGLVNSRTRVKVDIPQGTLITYDMVELAEDSYILQLRREQDKLLAEGKLVWD